MLTKTESTALLRYLARGLKNNTISKAHGRQLMDLATKVRQHYKVGKQATNYLRFNLFQKPDRFKLLELSQNSDLYSSVPDNLKKIYMSLLRDSRGRENVLHSLQKRVAKNLYNDFYNKNLKRAPDFGFYRTVATPLQGLLKNPANKVISKGTFNSQKVDPYRRGFAGKDANIFGDLFIAKYSKGDRASQFITAYPQVAAAAYSNHHPGSIVIEYDLSKLRELSARNKSLPLMWGPHQAYDGIFDRLKTRLKYGGTRRSPNTEAKDKAPYYQTIAL